MKISVVIAAKNEVNTIQDIVLESRKFSEEVLVIDGHSNDETVRKAEQAGARVFYDNKKGKGEALRLGIKEVRGDIIVFLDADGFHSPEDIPRLTTDNPPHTCQT